MMIREHVPGMLREAREFAAKRSAREGGAPMCVWVRWTEPPTYYVRSRAEGAPNDPRVGEVELVWEGGEVQR